MSHTSFVVVSVGGSLIAPDGIDTAFLKKFKTFILSATRHGKKFIIITGGGKTARNYQHAANVVTPLTKEDLDWLGIHATRLNAHLLRAIFYKEAHPIIITNSKKDALPKNKGIIIAAGFRPGASTDLRAVELAQRIGAKSLVNLSNIDYVFDKDPKKHKDAKRIETIDWRNFRALLPKKWDPGLSAPFDPVAAKLAQKHGLEVAVINGAHLGECTRFINGKKFKGTLIR